MTVYAPSDVRSITIPADRGGCGKSHELIGELADGDRFAIDCPACEPHIIAARTGWAHTPHGVHLTPDEIAQVEAEEARAKREQNRTWGSPEALGSAFAAAMAAKMGAPSASAPTLMEQIVALSPEERAALGAMLTGGAVASIEAAPAADGEGDEDEDSEDEGNGEGDTEPAAATAAPRRPGRPRKITQ